MNTLPRIVECASLWGLQNENSSCYLDSALFALYAIPNKIIEDQTLFNPLTKKFSSCKQDPVQDWKHRTKLQKEIQIIVRAIRHGDTKRTTAKKLRNLFDECDKYKQFNNDDENRDVQEFIMSLLSLFECNAGSSMIVTLLTNNIDLPIHQIPKEELIQGLTRKEESPVLMINASQLQADHPNHIQKLLTHIEDSGELSPDNWYQGQYKRRIEVRQVFDSNWLIIWINRTVFNQEGQHQFNHATVHPDESITLTNGKKLYLSSIITHSGKSNDNGHYTCFVKCPKNIVKCENVLSDFWMSYNDLDAAESYLFKDLPTLIENVQEGTNSDVLRRGIVYIYTE